MRTNKTHAIVDTNNAGVPPAPSEAHQRAGVKRNAVAGDEREVTMNGSRMRLRFDGAQWWVIDQKPAPFTRSQS